MLKAVGASGGRGGVDGGEAWGGGGGLAGCVPSMAHESVLHWKEWRHRGAQAHFALDDVRLSGVEAGLGREPSDEDVYAEEGGGVEDAHAVQPAKKIWLVGCRQRIARRKRVGGEEKAGGGYKVSPEGAKYELTLKV